MKLVFLSETATGRPVQRVNALTDELVSTRVQIVCADITARPQEYTKAGSQMRYLMRAMRLLRFVTGSELRELRAPVDLEEAVAAILEKGKTINSIPYPVGPRVTSLIVVANAQLLAQLAPHFGLSFDPTLLYNVVEVDLAA
ncbi:MAG TPA: hypothetical protein VGH44_00815 [Candidatus Saccharimonadia bacterium]|jgi:hypothetical protein